MKVGIYQIVRDVFGMRQHVTYGDIGIRENRRGAAQELGAEWGIPCTHAHKLTNERGVECIRSTVNPTLIAKDCKSPTGPGSFLMTSPFPGQFPF